MRTLTVVVTVLLVLAGCNAVGPTVPTAAPPDSPPHTSPVTVERGTPQSPTATERPSEPSPASLAASYDIETEGGDLPVKYSLVYARVAVMLNRSSVEPPERVRIEADARMGIGTTRYPEFYRLLGIRIPEGEDRALTAAAYVASPDTVTVNRRILNRTNLTEQTLAHESVHVVQFRTDAFQRTATGVTEGRPTTDESLVQRSVTEGVATYTETVYARRYDSGDANRTQELGQRYRNATGAVRLGIAPYYFGARYTDGRVDDPAETRTIYDDPPRTSEELIHGLPPGSEPVANLSVREVNDDGWEHVPTTRDTFGELFVRVVLGNQLNESAAATGADGWAADERVAFRNASGGDRETGYAWVIRFDDAANATEFASAFDEWRDNRTTEGVVRSERVDDRTVAVYLGAESFVSTASASGENGTVTVRAGQKSNGSPNAITTPTSAMSAPRSACPAVNACMGEVMRSSSNSR